MSEQSQILDQKKALQGIRRIVEVAPREIGSRIVTSDHLRALIGELGRTYVGRFSYFTVIRFGQADRLEYPSEDVHNAIDSYDVARIYGKGYRDKSSGEPFIEIDLWNGGHIRNWEWLFRLSGPRSDVDGALAIIFEQAERWPRTWHRAFHWKLWWAPFYLATFFFGWYGLDTIAAGVTRGQLLISQ